MSESSFEKRLVLVEVKAILLDNGLVEEANKLAEVSKTLENSSNVSDKERIAAKTSKMGITSIRNMQRCLLDTTPGFLKLDPIRRAALLYLASRIGYVGITSNHRLWDKLNECDYNGAAFVINEINFLNKPTRQVVADLIRSGDEQRHG